jgi:hypothetical protein
MEQRYRAILTIHNSYGNLIFKIILLSLERKFVGIYHNNNFKQMSIYRTIHVYCKTIFDLFFTRSENRVHIRRVSRREYSIE